MMGKYMSELDLAAHDDWFNESISNSRHLPRNSIWLFQQERCIAQQ
jgi:hypothetical protein